MVADVSDYQRIAYIKHAMVSWETGRLVLNGGLRILGEKVDFDEVGA